MISYGDKYIVLNWLIWTICRFEFIRGQKMKLYSHFIEYKLINKKKDVLKGLAQM